jgi:hypothetical protein
MAADFVLPVTVGLGDNITVAGTIAFEMHDGVVEDIRKPYADALREIAHAIDGVGLDDEEVPDAAAHG